MIALPAGILASGFTEQFRLRREDYQQDVEEALKQGDLTSRQKTHLEETRIALGLSHEEAVHILNHAMQGVTPIICPHCGKSIGPNENPEE
jgi:voltage-gated potassium channel